MHIKTVIHLALACALLFGCASRPPQHASRPFDFARDTFAFRNELVWEYQHTSDGKTTIRKNNPKPTYYQRCFVVTRAAREFFDHARFDPAIPRTTERAYRKLVGQIIGRSAREPSAEHKRVVIPGYADLRSFSEDWEYLLKQECGGAWQSYLQRGNWRIILPFSGRHQTRMARRLIDKLEANRPVIVHLVRFPALSINHGILLYSAKTSGAGVIFEGYDPNDTERPVTLAFDDEKRCFDFPRNNYFAGGPVRVYEIYSGVLH